MQHETTNNLTYGGLRPIAPPTKTEKSSVPHYGRKLTDADKAMYVLRRAIDGRNIYDLSKEVGVSASCLYAISSGRTKWPRPNTFFGLLRALDLEMYLVNKP